MEMIVGWGCAIFVGVAMYYHSLHAYKQGKIEGRREGWEQACDYWKKPYE